MGTRLFIGGLGPRVRERDLEDFFDGFGRIREIVIKGEAPSLVLPGPRMSIYQRSQSGSHFDNGKCIAFAKAR